MRILSRSAMLERKLDFDDCAVGSVCVCVCVSEVCVCVCVYVHICVCMCMSGCSTIRITIIALKPISLRGNIELFSNRRSQYVHNGVLVLLHVLGG